MNIRRFNKITTGFASIILATSFFVSAATPVYAVDCTADNFTSGKVTGAVSFIPTKFGPSDKFTVKASVSFTDTSLRENCKNIPISFQLSYFADGSTLLKQSTVKAKSSDQDPPLTATDQNTWSTLSQQSADPTKPVALSVQLSVVVRGTAGTGPFLTQAAATVDPSLSKPASPPAATPPAGSGTPPATPAKPPTTGTPPAASVGNCGIYGAGYTQISDTTLCVPPGPLGTPSSTSIAGSSSIFGVIAIILRILLIMAGVLAVLFLVIGGFMYLTSAGNEEQAAKGRKAITYAIIGLIIIVLALAIVTILIRTLTSSPENILNGGSTPSTSTTSPGTGNSAGGSPPPPPSGYPF